MPEDDMETDKTLRAACVRLTRQQWYNQKHTAANHFMSERGKRAKKEDNVKEPPQMTVSDYISVSKLSIGFYIAAKLPLHYLFLN